MASKETISIFYSVYTQKDVDKTFETRIKDQFVTPVKNADDYVFTIGFDGNRIYLAFEDDVELIISHLVAIRYYFNFYDQVKNVVYTSKTKHAINFFVDGLKYFKDFNFTVNFNFNDKDKRSIIKTVVKNVPNLNIDLTNELLDYLVVNFNAAKEYGVLEFIKKYHDLLEEEKTEIVLENLNTMELPMDWTNIYLNDERAQGVFEENIGDGLVKCLNVLGKVDIEYISSITGYSLKEVIIELGGTIYQNPLYWEECFYKGYETADEYLSGNIYEKLRIAEEYNKKYKGYFKKNVDALKLVKPHAISSGEVYVTLGSPWLPSEIIDQFIDETFGTSYFGKCYGPTAREELKTIHDELTGSWEIPYKNRYLHYNVAVSRTYGTAEHNALHILERTLNMRTIEITTEVKNGLSKKRVIDKEQTTVVLEKQRLLIDKFRSWVWSNESRKKYLMDIYEQKYCSNVIRRYDGSFLEFPGLNEDIKLYNYQKNSIARILFSPNTLLAHEVGAGKTYVMIAAGMELKRIGISSKNMYVVPNSLVGQWSSMFTYLYPSSKVLAITPSMFTKTKMFETLKEIKDEDFDAVIIPYSCFDRMPISKNYLLEILKGKLDELQKQTKKKKQTTLVKSKIKSLQEEIEKLEKEYIDNEDAVFFDELGVSTLFVDEAHNYKNLTIETKIKRVNGMTSTGSKKCDEMMLKVRCVQKNNNGRGVVFATGTPITNSLSDIYVMQMYLQSGELSVFNLQNFDSWVGMFVEKETSFEIDIDTTNYRITTRFSNYHNMPELSTILSNVIDFYNVDDSDELPKMNGYIDVTIPQTNEFKQYLKTISERAEKIRKHKVNRKDDNLLKVTTDGRKAALDLRLVKPEMQFYLQSKVAYCAENIFDIYFKYYKEKYAQLVFCDISTPKDEFNIYDDLKYLLTSYGIPEDEIAYIHDATTDTKRNRLFDDVRRGKVRILIGSTFKLGTGVNVQDKLIALHHLDIPWRPADIIQREGRIVRQGNENEEVFIYRYITEGSFDAYSWQILESKQKMINALLKGCMTERMCEEVEAIVLNYGEIKALALGNPLLKKRVETSNELNRYRLLQKKYVETRYAMEIELSDIPDRIKVLDDKISGCEEDIKIYLNNKAEYDEEARKMLRTIIYNAIIDNELSTEEVYICDYQGFRLIVPTNIVRDQAYLYVEGYSKYHVDMGNTELGTIVRLDNFLERLPKIKDDYLETKEKLLKKESDLKEELSKDNYYAEIIERLEVELKKIDEVLGVEIK